VGSQDGRFSIPEEIDGVHAGQDPGGREMEMPPTTRNVCVYVCEIYVFIERKEKKILLFYFTFSDRQAPNYDSDCTAVR
jgi:hypothetical protein